MILSLASQGLVWAGVPMPENERFASASSPKTKSRNLPKDARAMAELYRKRGADLDNFIYEAFDPSKVKSPAPAADTGTADAVGLNDFRRTQKKWWLAAGAAGLVGTGIVGYFLLTSGSGKTKIVNIDYTDAGSGN